jgi:excinuclease ABC subunit B
MQGMHVSDIKRKQKLVDRGFLLPSALDRRPLTLSEFEDRVNEIIYVSATPGPYELARAGNAVVEQQIRPTGRLDPVITIKPACIVIEHLTEEIRQRAARGERTLVMTMTKSEAEDLVDQLQARGINCKWMHSDLTTPERNQLLADLREDKFDALVGCNLLREGLDLPMVSLVAILKAERKGFMRNVSSFIQMIGRAARHENGTAILYADTVTPAMARAQFETLRRRRLQKEFNAQQHTQSTVTDRSA